MLIKATTSLCHLSLLEVSAHPGLVEISSYHQSDYGLDAYKPKFNQQTNIKAFHYHEKGYSSPTS